MARNLQDPTQPDLPAGSVTPRAPAPGERRTGTTDRGTARGAGGEGVSFDPEALLTLEPRMRAVALRITRDPDAARDVVQSAAEKIWRHRRRFRGEALLSTWVHRIVVNEALMLLRSRKRQRSRGFVDIDSGATPNDEVVDASPSAASRIEHRQELDRLYGGLAQLSDDERDVLVRCALEGWSYERFGRSRGLGTAAVKSRAFRARRQLARMLIR